MVDNASIAQRIIKGQRPRSAGVASSAPPSFTRGQSQRREVEPRLDAIDTLEEQVALGADGAVKTMNGVVEAANDPRFLPLLAAPMLLTGAAGLVQKGAQKVGWQAIANGAGNFQNRLGNLGETGVLTSVKNSRPVGAIANAFNRSVNALGSGLEKMRLNKAGGMVRELPAAVGKAGFGSAVFNGVWIAGSALGAVGGVTGFGSGLANLKRMAMELTGRHVSTLDIFFGDVPPVIRRESWQLVKSLLATESSSIFSLGFAVRTLVVAFSWPLMFATMAFGMGANMLAGEGLLPTYSAMKEMMKTGQEIPAEAYAKMIGIGSQELKMRGGEEGAFAQALAAQYAAEKALPEQVLREISGGGLKARIEKLIADNAAAKLQAPAAEIAQAPARSHVTALSAPQAAVRQPVVGRHTAALAAAQPQLEGAALGV